jgi:serine/threonine protein phosphatase PrpC
MMIYTETLETYEQLTREQVNVEQLPMILEGKLPAAPFPRKFVLSVFVDLHDARQAASALRSTGFNERDIHILQSHDFVKSVTQDQSPFEIITSIDYDIYLREAQRKRFFLAVRPGKYAQLNQIRDLLVRNHGYLANYIDTWTVTELLK